MSHPNSSLVLLNHAGLWQTCAVDVDEPLLDRLAADNSTRGPEVVQQVEDELWKHEDLDCCTTKTERLYGTICGEDYTMRHRATQASGSQCQAGLVVMESSQRFTAECRFCSWTMPGPKTTPNCQACSVQAICSDCGSRGLQRVVEIIDDYVPGG